MSMFDTVEIAESAPFVDQIHNEEWQVHLKSMGASYRITEDLDFELSQMRFKDGVEKGEDDPIYPDDIEQYWGATEYTGPLSLSGRSRTLDLVLDDGHIIAVDPSLVRVTDN